MEDVLNLGQQLRDATAAREMSQGGSGGTSLETEMARAGSMPASQLKAELQMMGVPHEHCLEKTELVALLARERVMRG